MTVGDLLDLHRSGTCPACRARLEPTGDDRFRCRGCDATWGRPR